MRKQILCSSTFGLLWDHEAGRFVVVAGEFLMVLMFPGDVVPVEFWHDVFVVLGD